MAKKRKKVIDIEYDEKEKELEEVVEDNRDDSLEEEVSEEVIAETDEVVNEEDEESDETEEVVADEDEESDETEEVVDDEECSCENCSCHKKSRLADLLLILIVVVLLVGSFFAFGGIAKKIELPVTIAVGETAGLHEVDYETYFALVDSGEPFILIVERTGCSYCEAYMPVVQEVVDERQIPIYYINMYNWESEDLDEFLDSNSYVRGNNWGTPSTLLLVGNRVAATITQYVEKEELLEFLDENVIFE